MLRVKTLTFHDGQSLTLPDLTIVAGPNNSGKSTFLREISQRLRHSKHSSLIIESMTADVDPNVLEQGWEWGFQPTDQGIMGLSQTLCAEAQSRLVYPEPSGSDGILAKHGEMLHTFLTTATRLRLTEACQSADRHTLLRCLYYFDHELSHVSDELRKAGFDIRLLLDTVTLLGRICLRVAHSDLDADMPGAQRRRALAQLDKLDAQGDGLRAMAGMILALSTMRRPVVLIDEPELFLHPPHAFRMGQLIAELSHATQFIVATHSADFLRGVLSATPELAVVTTISRKLRIADAATLRSVANDPILSANRTLESVFYRHSLVVEADSDAIVYARIAQTLELSPEVHFIRAQNKQTLAKVLEPLRRLGVEVSCIADFDILHSSHEFRKLLESTGAPVDPLVRLRDQVAKAFEKETPAVRITKAKQSLDAISGDIADMMRNPESGILELRRRLDRVFDDTDSWAKAKMLGREALDGSQRIALDTLLQECVKFGVFIVPTGELESLFKEIGLDYNTPKHKWLSEALSILERVDVRPDQYPWKFVNDMFATIL